MPVKLSTTINKISSISDSTNAALIKAFYEFMKNNGASEKHINNNLKVILNFADHIDNNTTFFDIQRKEQVMKFLDTKTKSITEDPDGRWITTWNHQATLNIF
jgi:integrase/recombinase XerD